MLLRILSYKQRVFQRQILKQHCNWILEYLEIKLVPILRLCLWLICKETYHQRFYVPSDRLTLSQPPPSRNLSRPPRRCHPTHVNFRSQIRRPVQKPTLITRKQIFILERTLLSGTTLYIAGYASSTPYTNFAFLSATNCCPSTLSGKVESSFLRTWPAT